MICCLAWIIINCRGIHTHQMVTMIPALRCAVSKSIVPNKLSKLWVSNPQRTFRNSQKDETRLITDHYFSLVFYLFGSYYFNSAYFRGKHRTTIDTFIYFLPVLSSKRKPGRGKPISIMGILHGQFRVSQIVFSWSVTLERMATDGSPLISIDGNPVWWFPWIERDLPSGYLT